MKQYRVYVTVESFDEDGYEIDKESDQCIARFAQLDDALDFGATIEREADEWRKRPEYKEKLV